MGLRKEIARNPPTDPQARSNLARRIVRMAWEDIGLVDPRSMQIYAATDCSKTRTAKAF